VAGSSCPWAAKLVRPRETVDHADDTGDKSEETCFASAKGESPKGRSELASVDQKRRWACYLRGWRYHGGRRPSTRRKARQIRQAASNKFDLFVFL
jgi:hypothetical protein